MTGAGGLIGSHLLKRPLGSPAPQVKGWTRDMLDLTDSAAVEEAFNLETPSMIIHCAAMSKSTECASAPLLAHQVNVEATRRLASLAANIPFLFISTDLVFDGRRGSYTEADPVNPLSVYAETKVAAEKFVLENPRHTVVRTSLNAGHSPTGDRGFNEEIKRAWKQGRNLTFFTDEYRSPLFAEVTAKGIWELLQRGEPGLYHLSGSERLSRYEIGKLLAALWPELNPRFQAGSLQAYSGPPRAPDTSLNCLKIQALLSFSLPRFSDWLKNHPADC